MRIAGIFADTLAQQVHLPHDVCLHRVAKLLQAIFLSQLFARSAKVSVCWSVQSGWTTEMSKKEIR
jgi:hypothetical protein